MPCCSIQNIGAPIFAFKIILKYLRYTVLSTSRWLRLLCLWLAIALFGASTACAQPDYAPALWNPAYTNHWYTSGCCHSFCIIHDMEGYYEATISYFQASGTSASIHYAVCSGYQSATYDNGDPGGQITQMVRESNWAWHVLCWNKFTVGTEHEGFVSSPAWYTTAMYQASAGLQIHLCNTYGIPKDRQHIIGHNEWQNASWKSWMATHWPEIDTSCNNHTDPGQYWDWTGFMNLVCNGGPQITGQPANTSVATGSNATLSATASGNAPLTWQWQRNGVSLPGATNAVLSITNAQATNIGSYVAIASNALATATSSVAFVSVLLPLTNAPGAIAGPSNVIAWWPAEGTANDIFSTNNGLLVNGVSYTSGKIGLSFNFDGKSGFVIFSGATDVPPPWSATFWVNRQNAPGSSATLLGSATSALKLEQYNGTRKVGFTLFGVSDNSFNYTAPLGTWTHLAFVGTTSNTALYANGVSIGSIATSFSLPRSTIGADLASVWPADYLSGSVDEIMLYNQALSPSQISALYAAGAAGPRRAPEFGSRLRLQGGSFTIDVVGQWGKTFSLSSSSNLTTWTPLVTLPNTTGSNSYSDPSSLTASRRFYRLSQP